jgi:hypothetical protein
VHGLDGDVGGVEDVYFDDQYWVVRHLVVDSRHWLRHRMVLIPPAAVRAIDGTRRRVEVALTRARVEQSPPVDTSNPVSRQHHEDLYDYYDFPYNWTGLAVRRDRLAGLGGGDPHLRSARAVAGYRALAVDGEIGLVEDFFIETESWAIRYVAVRSGHRREARHVLIAPEWITRVSWEGRLLETDLSYEAIRGAPKVDGSVTPDRAYETRLHDHYRRPPYWEG